jgi:hypothetical protein
LNAMTTRFTPGPWKLDPVAADDNDYKPRTVSEVFQNDSPHKYRVADVYAWGSAGERDATAQLIAAAPDMHDALEMVMAWMTNVNVAEPHEIAAKVINALKAAGYDRNALDFAAMAMISGAAHR